MKTTPLPVCISVAAPTPLGPVWLAVSPKGLVAVENRADPAEFAHKLEKMGCEPGLGQGTDLAAQASAAAAQMCEYLNGARTGFDFPIDWERLPSFQRRVLQATFAIPYGQTRTYQQIAAQVGSPLAPRAVGRAEATNPMPLVVPCHRVLGTDGKLHGYGGPGGLETKEWLLHLEGAGK